MASCRVDLWVGATVPVRLKSPYPARESFQVDRVLGAAARVSDQAIDRDGDDTFTIQGISPDVSEITASAPGPADAPGKTLVITVALSG
ncbi:hypothetical protein LN042_31740 [Kitasatospora sp. RB6PN24]|uniref:hypothetical protein n=1 Tax=Kitasatospora humi TaxID=2893891 RepID=UPI001E48B2F3|nr:hypothetical protein [Kitasatospora humi]MCC9311585.1 hypothetical protein [Kitasatospora humi]